MQTENTPLYRYFASLTLRVDDVGYMEVHSDWGARLHAPVISRLWLIEAGSGCVVLDGREYFPKPGQLVLLPAGHPTSYSAVPKAPYYTQYWADFDARMGMLPMCDVISLPVLADIDGHTEVREKFAALAATRNCTDVISALTRKSLLYSLLADFILLSGAEKPKLLEQDKLKAVFSYIESHLDEPISVSELAATAHYNPSYFIRFFKSRTGCTPVQYINSMKIQRAKQLLLTTDMSVRQVAFALAYCDESYFARIFQRITGYTPTFFRHSSSEKRRP